MEGSDVTRGDGSVPIAATDLGPLDRLRYELELVQEDLTALQSEQEATLAQGGEAKQMVHLARMAADLRARHSRVRQALAEAERAGTEH
jgi:hypothetical protein